MKGFKVNIEQQTKDNKNFRKVLYTGKHIQLVLMSLATGEDIGLETHEGNDQFFRFESGSGKCIIDDSIYEIAEGDVVVIPAGAKHNIINTGADEFKMYTIYGPPNHQDGTIRVTKEAAEKNDEVFDGKTSE